MLYAALAAESSGTVLFFPALQARTRAIVGIGTALSSANSLNAVSDGTVRLIGGPLGGLLLAVYGVRWLIVADVLSYLLSATANWLTSRPAGGLAGQPETGHAGGTAALGAVGRELAEGLRILRGQPVARVLLPVMVIYLAANASLSAVLIPFGVQQLGGNEPTGLLLSALGVGFLVGGPAIRRLLGRVRAMPLLAATLAACAAAYFVLFTSSSLGTALPAAVAVGLFGSMSLVISQTTTQRVIPNEALGRVSAVFLTGEAAATLAGAAAGPFLAQQIHLTGVAAAASVLTLAAAATAAWASAVQPVVVVSS